MRLFLNSTTFIPTFFAAIIPEYEFSKTMQSSDFTYNSFAALKYISGSRFSFSTSAKGLLDLVYLPNQNFVTEELVIDAVKMQSSSGTKNENTSNSVCFQSRRERRTYQKLQLEDVSFYRQILRSYAASQK